MNIHLKTKGFPTYANKIYPHFCRFDPSAAKT